jgi:hypothetical protein
VTSAAIYARVSSARQKKDQTIGSQTEALRDHAGQNQLDVPPQWVFEDEGHSGATLVRPALEALRDLAAQGCLDAVPGTSQTSSTSSLTTCDLVSQPKFLPDDHWTCIGFVLATAEADPLCPAELQQVREWHWLGPAVVKDRPAHQAALR